MQTNYNTNRIVGHAFLFVLSHLRGIARNKPVKHLSNVRQNPKKGVVYFETLQLMNTAKECAQLFQRSSSCLEGRNGYLSLRHHGLHHLSDRKLGALTVIHNYFTTRPDHTTAAERLFSKKPRNLFEHLTEKLPSVSRPALQAVAIRRAA